MRLLIAGIVLFAGPHLFGLLLPALRDRLRGQWGEGPWKGLYSAISLLGLVLMVWGFVRAHRGIEAADWLYLPFPGARHVTELLVLLGFVALAAAHGRSHIRLWLKNPMSIGVSLWAVGHLAANGRKIDALLFGTLLVVALVDIVVSTARGKVPAYEPAWRADIVAVVAGLVLYAVFLFGVHPYIFGIPVVT